MPYDPDRHHRRSIRLRGYDYRQAGWYFVTICTHERQRLFDDPALRTIAEEQWRALDRAGARGDHPGRVSADVWVVMPDHVHGMIVIGGDTGDAPIDPIVGAQQPEDHSRRNADVAAAPLLGWISGWRQGHWARSFDRTRPRWHGGSIDGDARPAPRSGSAATTSASSATRPTWRASVAISTRIRRAGRRTTP